MSWIQWFLKSVALNWHLGEYFGQKSIRLLDVEKIVKLGCQVSERRRIIWCCIINKHFLKSDLMYCSFFFVLFLKCHTTGYNLRCILQCAFKFCLSLINVLEPSVTASVKLRWREAHVHFANYRKMKTQSTVLCFIDIAVEVLWSSQRCKMINDVPVMHICFN